MQIFQRLKTWALYHLGLLPKSSLQQQWDANLAAHKQYKQQWDTQQQQHGFKIAAVQQAHKAQSGNPYFVFADFGAMSHERFLTIERVQNCLSQSIDDPKNFDLYINKFCQTILHYIQNNKGDALQKVKDAVVAFQHNSRVMPKIAVFCQLAACFMLRHDENPYSFDSTIHLEKVQELYNDSMLRTFFLHYSLEMQDKEGKIWAKLKSLNFTSTDDFVAYSARQIVKEKQNQQPKK